MAEAKQVVTPLTDEVVRSLKCGDMVNVSGVIYTGRDAAHSSGTAWAAAPRASHMPSGRRHSRQHQAV